MIEIPTAIDMEAVGAKLAEDFMLSNVSVRMWSGKFPDHAAAAEIDADAVGRKFFPGALGAGFSAVNSLLNKMRNQHYDLTLAWSVTPRDATGDALGEHSPKRTGYRLLPTRLLFDHATVIATAEKRYPRMLDAIGENYDALVQQASKECNQGKFPPEFYPTFEEVRAKYDVHRDYSPLPVPQSFREMGSLHPKVVEGMIQRLLSSQQKMLANAIDDLVHEFRQTLAHVIERFEDNEEGGRQARIRSTTLTNVTDAAKRMESFGLRRDSNLDTVLTMVDTTFGGVTMKDVRDDDGLRRGLRVEAMRVLAALDRILEGERK